MNKYQLYETFLENVCDFQNGFAYKSSKFRENGLPIIRISNLQLGSVSEKDIVYFDINDYKENLDKYKVFPGDILIAMSGGTTGKIAVNTSDKIYYLNQRVGKFSPKDCLNKNYLYYFLITKIKEGLRIAEGAAIPNLSSEQIKKYLIPVPHLEEQQKIVEKLDKAFELIDEAKANIEQNIINAKELFQSKLDEVFSQKGDGWKENKLTELSKITYGCTEKALQEDTGIKYLRITDINNGEVHWHEVPFCKLSTSDEVKYRLTDGDIVFARTGATTGKSFIYHDEVNSVYASYLIRLQVSNTHKINPDFVYWYFQSGEYWRIIRTGMTGSTLGGFNAKKLGEIILHYPENVDVQKHLIDEFVSLQDETNRIINLYNVKLSNLEELRKSILEKAFKGELTN